MDELRSPVTAHRVQRGGRLVAVSLLVVLVGSVALFASLNAWRSTPPPLVNTLASPQAVGEAVLSAVQTGDVAALQALAVTEEEFRRHVWPELPASRPERNVPFELVWGTLHQHSTAYLRHALSDFDGQQLALKRVAFGGASTTYGHVTVHRDSRLVVESADERERVVHLFGSMIEQDGRWKVFSYVVD